MELREKIQRLIFEADGSDDWSPCAGDRAGKVADAILALPEIREALALKARQDLAYEAQRLKLGY